MGGLVLRQQIKQLQDETPVTHGYLLDTYSGVAMAYALRKLSSSSPSNCIRVRRSSDSTEQDIGYSGDLLDESSLLSFCGAGDGFIRTVYDQSGNSIDQGNASTTAQPKIVSSGVVLREGIRPCISFDGVDDRLFFGSTSIFNNKTNGAMFVAGRHRSRSIVAQRVVMWVSTAGGGITRLGLGGSALGKFLLLGRRLDGDSSQSLTGHDYDTGFPVLQTGIWDWGNSDAYLYVNKELQNSTTSFQTSGSTTNVNSVNVALGANATTTDFSPFNMLEAIAFNTDQSANRTGIEDNMNNYLAIF